MAIVKLVHFYLLSFVALLMVLSLMGTRRFPWLEQITGQCWMHSAANVRPLRGQNYLLTGRKSAKEFCLVTTWSVAHFLMYALIGYIFPRYFWQSFAVGVAFEGLEWITLDCHDVLDIAWNSCGFVFGAWLRQI